MEFICPECKDTSLFEVMTNIIAYSECWWNKNHGIQYREQTNEGGEVDSYTCSRGHVLLTPEETNVQTEEELKAWLELHNNGD